MSMKEWARREVELACKRENPDRKEGEFDYGCACYESALKAFESLCDDGHSGFSIQMTRQILNRLLLGKPLGAIKDTDDVWNEVCFNRDDSVSYQCKRMSSLFKYVYKNGAVEYHDTNRFVCFNIDSPCVGYRSGFANRIFDKMYPITMPYFPDDEPYKIYCEDFLVDPKNGDFDTYAILYLITPSKERVDINRFFKEEGGDWVEINLDEYLRRKKGARKDGGAEE